MAKIASMLSAHSNQIQLMRRAGDEIAATAQTHTMMFEQISDGLVCRGAIFSGGLSDGLRISSWPGY
jgi:hypothetical protein